MGLLVTQEGKLTKLKFISYSDITFNDSKKLSEYEVMFNPSSLAVKLQVERDQTEPDGAINGLMKFKKLAAQDYTFEFIIDGTGANGEPKKEVPDEVRKFLSVAYDYSGTEHKPNYIKILYGSVLLKCVLKSVDVTYNLFSPNGKPLRAKINSSFNSCADPELSAAIKNDNSPDMTHLRKLKRSDKLISFSNTIYKKNSLYLEVARANEFDSFRNLPEGTAIFFPPLAKK